VEEFPQIHNPRCTEHPQTLPILVESQKKKLSRGEGVDTSVLFNDAVSCMDWGMRWRNWLRHCAANRKVAGSIPDVTEIFHLHNSSGRTTALALTQPLTEMSTRSTS
jgi:hypothetical protein